MPFLRRDVEKKRLNKSPFMHSPWLFVISFVVIFKFLLKAL